MRFIRDHGLSVASHPEDWADAFFPCYEKQKKTCMTPYHMSVEKLCRWSNEKATLLEMGTPSKYPDFKAFTTKEFEQYMFLPFWNGMCSPPSVEMKLSTEEASPSIPMQLFGVLLDLMLLSDSKYGSAVSVFKTRNSRSLRSRPIQTSKLMNS